MLKRTLLLCTAAGLLSISACALNPPKTMMDVQSGEQFTLKQALSFKPDTARVFIQYGKVILPSERSQFDPYCALEINALSDQAQTIQPDTFTIDKVRLDEQEVAQNLPSPTLTAYNNYADIQADVPLLLADSSSDAGVAPTYDMVYFYISSPKNQNVLRLICSGSLSDGDPMDEPRSHRPQQKEVNKILGTIGKITP